MTPDEIESALQRLLVVPPDPDIAVRIRQIASESEYGAQAVSYAMDVINGALIDAGIALEPGSFTRFLATLYTEDAVRFIGQIEGVGVGDFAAVAYLMERMVSEP